MPAGRDKGKQVKDPQNTWTRGRILKAVALGIIGVAGFALIVHLSGVFVPLGLALLLAYILEPVISWLDRHHSRRAFTVSTFYALFLAILAVGGSAIVPPLIEQGKNFVSFVREQGEKYGVSWGDLSGQTKTDDGAEAASERWWAALLSPGDKTDDSTGGAPETGSTEPRPPEPHDAEPRESDPIGQFVREHASMLKNKLPALTVNGIKAVITGAGTLAGFLVRLVLTLFYAFFFMLHFPAIQKAFANWTPRSERQEAVDVFSEIDEVVAGFFRGRLLVCLIAAAVASIGLLISGIDFWLLLGIAAGFLGIIPYVGVALTLIPAVLIALNSEQSLWSLVGVLITFGVVQGVVEPFVGPFVISGKVQLHPVTVIVAIMAGGVLFGILGMLLAVPVAGILKILARRYLAPTMQSVIRPRGV